MFARLRKACVKYLNKENIVQNVGADKLNVKKLLRAKKRGGTR